jgi:hypothetical protein
MIARSASESEFVFTLPLRGGGVWVGREDPPHAAGR